MNTTKNIVVIIGCAIGVLVLAFCENLHGAAAWEAEWERTVKAAEQEGELSYYTLGEFGFLSEFEKKFPRIKVRVVQGKGNDLLVRIMTERRAGKYLADVARIGNTSPYSLYQAKALQPAAAAFILPEVKDESKWWSGKHQYIDAEGKYIFVSVGSVSVNMVAHNSEWVAPAELASYWDLMKNPAASSGVSKDLYDNFSQNCHPRMFLSGVQSGNLPRFPLTACGNDGLR